VFVLPAFYVLLARDHNAASKDKHEDNNEESRNQPNHAPAS
jgi:multidrug efflux pump